jgi:hypothetical protein
MIEDLLSPDDPDDPNGGLFLGVVIALALEALAFAIGYFGRLIVLAAEGLR